MNDFRLHKRRAVSEIIGTILVLAITVAGAVFISNFAHDVFFTGTDQTSTTEAHADSIQLTGYDTRDSGMLRDIPTLDNEFNQLLCTIGCNTNPNNIPTETVVLDRGTEFFVLQIRNTAISSVFLHNVLINNEGHTWDTQTGNNDFDASNSANAGTLYPSAGKFSIISVRNLPSLTQSATNEVRGGEEVLLVIKLSQNIPQDIGMWDALRILVNFGGNQPAEFIILSGDAKW